MHVGVPKEIKVHEYRVGLTPPSVAELTAAGHTVTVETGAGGGIDFTDRDYVAAGATIVPTAAAVFAAADMIVKVKEPQLHECAMLRPGQVLFTYLHLAADKPQAEALMKSGAICIAYETVTERAGGLPLLRPMSEIAGRMSVQVGAHYLEKAQGGRGILLGGVPGVAPGRVAILGGGVSGVNAAQMAVGMRADVTIYDISTLRLAEIDDMFEGRVKTQFSSKAAIAAAIARAHVVIGAVLIPGAAAPKLVTRDMLKLMKRGSVLVDIAIDQGGCFETSRATTHEDPVYVVDGIIHYCVANMPGAVARTSTFALNNATLPFVLRLANLGADAALASDPHLAMGLNVSGGHIRHAAVAEALGLPHVA
ncbi:alanine dehydrogenase [Polymorphobacter arshaanensis]|uniref:Alanine dehydrogenase n=1 Tax=Glacieibacterium arshaanense TaxID=2511025 RepID=A0A4Y9ER85_9SPHN|nr:alanine dehydrogenase [Polymorphobacter arshaanensis]TFU03859.1 alanine dehydrogenase [Polymorphobacter arshaanensis]